MSQTAPIMLNHLTAEVIHMNHSLAKDGFYIKYRHTHVINSPGPKNKYNNPSNRYNPSKDITIQVIVLHITTIQNLITTSNGYL